jgi:histidinol-phosphate aminotransferase
MSLFRPEVVALSVHGESPQPAPIKADLNEAPWDWPQDLKDEAARLFRSMALNRYPTEGADLVSALADRWSLDPASILVGNGSNELLLALFLGSAGAGRKALYPRPSFGVYRQVAAMSGAVSIELPLDDGAYYRPVDWLDAVRRERPHLTLICSPNNPSGTCFPGEAIDELLEEAPGVVAIDEAYAEFAGFDARSHLDRHANLVVLRTFSKAWGAAAIRLGYLMAAPVLTTEIRKALLPFRLNRISAGLGLLALHNAARFEDRVREIVSERLRLYPRLKNLPGVTAYPSLANFILVRFLCRPAWGVCEELRARGIIVRRFPSTPGLEDCLRITVGTPSENDAVIRALQEVVS